MKIAHIITALPAEGAQVMLYKLLSRMRREQFDSTVISLTAAGTMVERLETLGVPVHSIGMKPGIPGPLSVWRLVRTIHQIKPDLIQGWMYHGNLAAQLAGALMPVQVPVAWNIRGSHYSLKDEKLLTAATIWLCAKLSKLPVKIINNSFVSALGHEQHLGYSGDQRVLIPNGFDTAVFSPSPFARNSMRAELNVTEDTLLIALIARYHPMKDHANFLQAASRLLNKHPKVLFILAGKGIDDSNNQLRKMLNELRISAHVQLLGVRNDIPRLCAAMDIVSLSSSYGEGFPNAIGEAMACGVPCVVTDIGDSSWIVGDTGQVVPPCNPEALASAWDAMIEMGWDGRLEKGKLARQRIIDNFSLDSVTNQYETLYEQVLSSREGIQNQNVRNSRFYQLKKQSW